MAAAGIAYVPFLPLGGFTPLQSTALSDVATQFGAIPMRVAPVWLLRRAPNILLISGTSSIGHRVNRAPRQSGTCGKTLQRPNSNCHRMP